jgi:hypothetical protein
MQIEIERVEQRGGAVAGQRIAWLGVGDLHLARLRESLAVVVVLFV